jgi:hypothetical protein
VWKGTISFKYNIASFSAITAVRTAFGTYFHAETDAAIASIPLFTVILRCLKTTLNSLDFSPVSCIPVKYTQNVQLYCFFGIVIDFAPVENSSTDTLLHSSF